MVMDSVVQSSREILKDDTDYLTDTDLLEMKSRLDDELKCLLIAQSSVSQESRPSDLEELQQRVCDLQQQLLEESNASSVSELLSKRIQTGKTLCDAIFNDDTNAETNAYISRSLEELELVSAIKRIQKETVELEEKLESLKLPNLQLRKENMEIIQRLQINKEKTQSISAQIAHNVNYKRLKSELDVKCMSLDVQKNIIQMLIVGMGQDWRQNPEFYQIMLECGEPLTL